MRASVSSPLLFFLDSKTLFKKSLVLVPSVTAEGFPLASVFCSLSAATLACVHRLCDNYLLPRSKRFLKESTSTVLAVGNY